MSQKQTTVKSWLMENTLPLILTVGGWFLALIAFYYSTNNRLTTLEHESVYAREQINECCNETQKLDKDLSLIQQKVDLLLENFGLELKETKQGD